MSSGTFDRIFKPNPRAFRMHPTINESHTTRMGTGFLSRAELEQPSCRACYRPLKTDAEFYCQKCCDSGAATRHRMNPHRLGASERTRSVRTAERGRTTSANSPGGAKTVRA